MHAQQEQVGGGVQQGRGAEQDGGHEGDEQAPERRADEFVADHHGGRDAAVGPGQVAA
ncbi:hypothetical protein GCM10027203_00170 [Nonomuraea fastidiosa]